VRRIKALLWVLLALPVTGVGVWFVQDNNTPVPLVLLGFRVGELPLGMWLTLTFFVGVLTALLTTLPTAGGTRLRMWRLEREIARLKIGAK
jgi:uncharacterized integral membrane protein